MNNHFYFRTIVVVEALTKEEKRGWLLVGAEAGL